MPTADPVVKYPCSQEQATVSMLPLLGVRLPGLRVLDRETRWENSGEWVQVWKGPAGVSA